jgi:hypothetical protein
LRKTRELLAAKQEQDRQAQPWQLLDEQAPSQPGFQPHDAGTAADALHLAESRAKAIQGSAATQDRRNQGKRDHR